MKLRLVIIFLMALLFASFVNAATIHGTIYDLSLKRVDNAKVEINTFPKQVIVAQNSSYSFNVPNGDYTIKAQLMQKNAVIASVQENITIRQDGFYVLDLILFPEIEEGIEDIEIDVNEGIAEEEKAQNRLLVTAILLALIAILIGYYYKKSKKQKQAIRKEEKYGDDYLSRIIKIIRQEGGRATQKEIRKQIPLSEAKISLMIAELEHKGIVEKIKKGRGNIIILKKR